MHRLLARTLSLSLGSTLLLLPLLVTPFITTSCNSGSYRSIQTGGYSFDNTGEKRTQDDAGPIEGDVHRVVIDHRFGAVHVYATDGAPEFAWSSTCWGKTASDADRFLEEITLDRTSEAGTHNFTLSLPEDPGSALRGVESVLTLKVPAATAVEVRNAFGDTEVVGIAGTVDGDCAHCSVELDSITGDLTFRTSFDDLRARNIAGGKLINEHGELHVDGSVGDLTIETSFDDATIANVQGVVIAENEHGSLAVTGVTGAIRASTSFDDLRVDGIGGDAHLRNSHGRIDARAVEGTLDAKSSFGEVFAAVSSKRVKIVNSHASIRAELANATLEEVELETSFDDIEVRVPRSITPVIAVDQKHGEISCPLAVHLDTPRADAASDGRPRVTLKIRHGDITVEQRD